jgi:23S rRNA pseudouridine1911/1915/1917 synthase
MAPEPTELIAQDLPLDILYEDDDLLVVNKAAGMVVHPGAGNRQGTLANALAHHLGKVAHGDPLRPGIVHRLDKGTSGILLVARNETAHESLAAQFKRREVEKVYLALVHGQAARAGEVDLAIGRDFRSRLRISTRTRRPREAITRYEAVRWWRWATLLRVFPQTGRTHQIRVHLLESGHPVVGDPLYRRRDRVLHGPWAKQERELNRLFLHATSLRFLHPTSGREMYFEAPLPAELEAFLSRLEE